MRAFFVATLATLVLTAGCAGPEDPGGGGEANCITTGFGAELCGQDAVNFCKDTEADARAARGDEQQLRREAIRDARDLARELGQSEAEAEQEAREDFPPTRKSAVERRGESICQEIYEAEGVK